MKILWAEKMAGVINGSYEHYIDDYSSKMVVRIYAPIGIRNDDFKKIKRMIPKDFKLTGIFYCKYEKQIFLFINQK